MAAPRFSGVQVREQHRARNKSSAPCAVMDVALYTFFNMCALRSGWFRIKYSSPAQTMAMIALVSVTGSFTVSGIDPSTTLIVKEVRAKDGYILDDVPQTAVINAGQTVTLEFRNQPMGSLLIRKVCSVNPSVTLANAEFKVAYSDGTLIGNSNGVYRSDENGEVRIDGLIPGKSVVVTETKAPAGFLIDAQSQTIVVQAGKTVTVTMKNQPRGKLIVQKRDSLTNQVLPGTQFRITTAAGCEVGLDGVIGTATLTSNGIFTTDSQGELHPVK